MAKADKVPQEGIGEDTQLSPNGGQGGAESVSKKPAKKKPKAKNKVTKTALQHTVNQNLVPIGQAATVLGVSIDTVRRWDKEGILNSSRPDGKTRHFNVEELEKIKFSKPLTISEASEQLDVSPSTLRRLEEKGLISPERSDNGERLYNRQTLEKFLHSEYFLRQKEVQAEILEPLSGHDDDAQGEKQGPDATRHDAAAHLVIGEHQEHLTKLNKFKRIALLSLSVLAGSFLLIIAILTILFFAFPDATAKGLGYYKKNPIGKKYIFQPADTLLARQLKPFSQTALTVVEAINPQHREKVAPKSKIKDVNDIFQPDSEGNISSIYTLTVPDSSYLKIPDTGLVVNLNSDYLRGKTPGSEDGDLAVLPVSGGPGGNIKDGSITGIDIADGAITKDKLAANISFNSTSSGTTVVQGTTGPGDGDITEVIAGNGLSGGGASGSVTLNIGTGDGLSAGSDTIGLVLQSGSGLQATSSGLSMLRSCANNELLKWNGSAWVCATDSGSGGSITVQESDGSPSINPTSTLQFSTTAFTLNDLGAGTASVALKVQTAKGLEQDSNGLSLIDCANDEILKYSTGSGAWSCAVDSGGGGGGSFNSFTVAGDSGAQTINDGDTLTILGGSGLTSAASATDTVTLNIGAGNGIAVNASEVAIQLHTGGGTGLQSDSSGLSLLRTCGSNEILKWNGAAWICSTDAGGLAIEEGDSTVSANASIIDFFGADFNVSDSPAGEANVQIDYSNSGITRRNQTETITGTWTFTDATTILQDDADNSKKAQFDLSAIASGATRTLTAPNVSGTLITSGNLTDINTVGTITSGTWQGTDIGVQFGGTGASSFTIDGVLYGNGTGAIQDTAAGTAGQLLIANASSVPTFVSLSGDASLAASGVLTLGNTGVTSGTFGSNTEVPQLTVDSKGRITSVGNVTISGVAPGGAASGDLSGFYPNPTVARINGVPLGATTATSGNVLIAEGSSWVSRSVTGDVNISSLGVTTIQPNSVVLGTDTSGNYVATISAGAGLTGDATGEGSNPTINVGAGDGIIVNADTITIDAITSGSTITSSNNSGLEVSNSGIRLLGGCGGDQVLQWKSGTSTWDCSTISTVVFRTFDVDSGTNPVADDPADTLTLSGVNGIQTTGDATTDTITLDLAALTTDWNQSGAFDIFLNNNGSELKILESEAGGTFVGTIDVGNLAADATYTFTGPSGNVVTDVTSPTGGDVSGTFSSGLVINANSVALGSDTTGDYVASFTAGLGLDGSASGEGSTPTLDIDLLTVADGTGLTSSNSGLEMQGAGNDKLTLLQGCGDQEILKWDDSNTIWECATDGGGGGGGSITVSESDGTPAVINVSNIQFGPASNSSDEFVVSDQTGGVARVRIGNQVGLLNEAETVTQSWAFNGGLSCNDCIALGSETSGDYVASITAGNGLSGGVTGEGSTPTLAIDTLGASDGTGLTSSFSGLEFGGGSDDQLTLLQGCADGQVLKWDDTSEIWKCELDAGSSLVVREADGSPSLTTTTIEFGPPSSSDEEFILSDQTGGITRVRVGNQVGKLNEAETVGALWTFNAGLNCSDCITLGSETTGNYVASITAGNGLSDSGTSGEGAIPVFDVNAGNGIELVADAVAVDLFGGIETDTSTTSSSASGLEFGDSGGLSLLRGCTNDQVLKFSTGSGLWACANDAGAAGSPFASSGGVIDKTSSSDRLRLIAGDLSKVQFEITNALSSTAPSNDAFQINMTDGGGITTNGVDGIYVNIEGGDGTSNTVSALHLDFDPVAASGDESFNAILIDAITQTAATETAIKIGNGWDFILESESVDISQLGNITGVNNLSVGGTVTLGISCTSFANGGTLTTDGSGNVICAADDGGSGVVWSALTDPTTNLALNHGEFTSTFNWNTPTTTTANRDYLKLTVTNDSTTDAFDERLLVLQNADDVSTNTIKNLLALDNADRHSLATALEITSSGVGGISTAIDVDDPLIGTALSFGANDITGTNFSVQGSSGNVTSGLVNGQTISSAANFTGTLAVNTSVTSPLYTGTGGVTYTAANGTGVTIGGASITNLIVTTDGTGDSEVQLPAQSIGANEIVSGSIGPTQIAADSLDFTEFKDALVLDASTSITQTGSNQLSFVNSGTSNILFNLANSGDLLIQDNGSAFVTFADNGTTTINSGGLTISAGALAVNSGQITSTSSLLIDPNVQITIGSNDNIQLQGTGSLLSTGSGRIDSSGTLNLGTATATSIVIGSGGTNNSLTVLTNGTGDGEVVLPNQSIGTNELADGAVSALKIQDDSLDFAQFIDAMTIDAATTISSTIATKSLDLNVSPDGTATNPVAFEVTPTFGLDAADQTLVGIRVNPSTNSNTDSGDTLYGIHLDGIVGTAATEYGLVIDSGYDKSIFAQGTIDTQGVIEAGTSNVQLTNTAGFIQAGAYADGSIDGDDLAASIAGLGLVLTAGSPDQLDIDLVSGSSGSTFSPSGLEFASGQLGMIQGCSDGQLLKWINASTVWQCSNDVSSGTPSLDSITAALSNTPARNSDANTLNWNWRFITAGSDAGLNISENLESTSGGQDEQALVRISTLAGSTASPLQVTAGGADVSDVFFNLSGDADFEIRDSDTVFASFDDSGNITLGKASAGGTIDLGIGSADNTINIGTGTNSTADAISIGNTANATSLALRSGSGDITLNSTDAVLLDAAGLLELNSSGGAINIGNDGAAQPINIGTGAAARTITVGNDTGATGLVFNTGTAGINLGDNANTKTIDIGGVDADGADTIRIATNATSADTITIGNNHASTALTLDGASINIGTTNIARTVNIGTGAAAQTLVIGSNNTTSQTTIRAGSNGLALNATAGNVALSTTTSGNISLAPGGTGSVVMTLDHDSTFQMTASPTSAPTSSVVLTLDTQFSGAASGSNGMLISQSDINSTGVYGTLLKLENLKNTHTTTNGLLIESNSSGGTITNALAITNTSGAVTNGIIFTGTITTDITTAAGRALTIDSGTTGAITIGGDSSAETLSFGTGGADKTVVVGSTNTTSGTTIQSGSDDIILNADSGAGNIIFGDGDTFAVGGVAAGLAYNAISNAGGTADGGDVADDNDLYIQGALEVDGNFNLGGNLTILGTSVSAANVTAFNCTDCLNFDDFADALTLDAATTIINALAGNFTIDLTSTGDFIIADSGTAFAQFLDDGAITLGKASAAGTINIGTGSGADTINIGTGITTADSITIGNTTGATSLALNSGTGDLALNSTDLLTLTSTNALSINASSGAINIGNNANAQPINVGTGAAARTITIGNTTGATGLTVNTGTGGITLTTTGGGDLNLNPADQLQINGTTGVSVSCGTTGNTNIAATKGIMTTLTCAVSDARLKTDVSSIESSLDKLTRLESVSYRYNDLYKEISGSEEEGIQFGFIAQEVQKLFPGLVRSVYGEYLTVDYQGFIPFIAKALGEVNSKVDANAVLANEGLQLLENRVVALEGTAGDHEIRLSQLEAQPSPPAEQPSKINADIVKANQIVGTDIGERYYTDDSSIEIGDLVSIDGSLASGAKKSSALYENTLLGVVSSGAGILVGSEQGSGREITVAVSGTVSAKVSTENGPIAEGDLLTSSSISGVAMKATAEGPIIGRAVGSYEGDGVGRVLVIADSGNGSGDITATLAAISDRVASLEARVDGIEASAGDNPDSLQNLTVESLTVTLDMQVVRNLEVGGALVVGGPAEFRGETVFHKLVAFVDRAVFKKDVEFEGRPTFNKDTAGFAVVKAGETVVPVSFEQEYVQAPVISVSLGEGKFATYSYRNVTSQGFEIVLQNPVPEDLKFSWIALSVKDANTASAAGGN